MPKLTKGFVDSLEVRETDYIIFDSAVGGFAVGGGKVALGNFIKTAQSRNYETFEAALP